MSNAAIQVQGLNHYFGQGEACKQAIWELNLEIERGKLTILMGPSGSGKTTVLTLMGCLREVQEGSLRLLGSEINGASEAQLTGFRRKLGFIFQAHNLHESLTATQNVQMGLQVHGPGNAATQLAATQHMLAIVGLADHMDYLPGSLSGGQKQRIAVARALVSNPEIVFADEPTAALDKESGMNVVAMLKALGQSRQTTTVMVTHDNRILELADRIITMEDGRIVGDTKL